MNDSQQTSTTSEKVKLNYALITLLQQKGLTQSQLAARIGRDRSYINRIIRGKEESPISMKLKIAKVLECDSRIIFPDSLERQAENQK